jgi:recombination protein RecR
MLTLPPALTELIHWLTRLQGVGPKAAERIALALLAWKPEQVGSLAEALRDATARVGPCPRCGALAQDGAECAVCQDTSRDAHTLCVVETPLDAVALERGGGYHGRYHVLGGALSPLRGVLPEDLRVRELLERVLTDRAQEVIVATNASPDGEATALYLKQVLEELNEGRPEEPPLRVTRLARGLPSGAQLDYADADTLASALAHRTEL